MVQFFPLLFGEWKNWKYIDRSIRRILKNDLEFNSYKIQKNHDLTSEHKQIRQFENSQNDRIYLADCSHENLSYRLEESRNIIGKVFWRLLWSHEQKNISMGNHGRLQDTVYSIFRLKYTYITKVLHNGLGFVHQNIECIPKNIHVMMAKSRSCWTYSFGNQAYKSTCLSYFCEQCNT